MKPLRLKKSHLSKAIGIAVGDRSLLAAEVTGGDKPALAKVAEFVYPDGVTSAEPDKLGAALGDFLKANGFSGRSAVVGLPARWLVVKPKDVPPADEDTLTDLLRIQAEGEFSTELRDLVYDYAADHSTGQPASVLLIATPQKYVDAAKAMCESARLSIVGVTPTAAALAAATGRSAGGGKPLVLAVGAGGAELTAVSGSVPSAIRHLRPQAERAFAGELRRAVSTLGPGQSIILWDGTAHTEGGQGGPMSAESLGADLGVPVRAGDLSTLGVDAGSRFNNGDGRQYAAAVSLGLAGVGAIPTTVDFLDPKLAAVPEPRFPRWTILAALAVIAIIVGVVYAYRDLQNRTNELIKTTATLDDNADRAKEAQGFVNQASFARRWYVQDTRYLSCLNDLTAAFPRNGQTVAVDLTLKDIPAAPSSSSGTNKPKPDNRQLSGLFRGATSSQENAIQVLNAVMANKSFSDVALGNVIDSAKGDVTFVLTFKYVLKGAGK